jgi:transporter family protein
MIELWIFLSISAAFLWSVSNIIDKYVLSRLISNPMIPVVISGFVALAIGLSLMAFNGFGDMDLSHALLALAGGGVYIFVLLLYFKAIKIGDITSLVPLFYLVPLFIAVIAWSLLGERLSSTEYGGIFLLVAGAFMISWDNNNPFKFGKAFWLMIFSTFLLAINQTITKYLFNFHDFWTVFSFISVGCFLPVIPLFLKNFFDLKLLILKNKKAVGFILASESLYRSASALITFAVAIGSVTLVNAISSIQPFFVLLIMALFSFFAPNILKEELPKSKIILKVVAITVMFVGGILVS